jgi:hypothetical protein
MRYHMSQVRQVLHPPAPLPLLGSPRPRHRPPAFWTLRPEEPIHGLARGRISLPFIISPMPPRPRHSTSAEGGLHASHRPSGPSGQETVMHVPPPPSRSPREDPHRLTQAAFAHSCAVEYVEEVMGPSVIPFLRPPTYQVLARRRLLSVRGRRRPASSSALTQCCSTRRRSGCR